MQPQTKAKSILIILGSIMGAAIIAFILFIGDNGNSGDNSSKVTTDITTRVVPSDSSIKINDKGVDMGVVSLAPGTYTVTASRKGFASQSRTVNLKEGDHVNVGLILDSNDNSTASYYTDNPDEAREAEGITGQNFDYVANSKVNRLPLLKTLPRRTSHYTITYGQSIKSPNDSAASVIYIQYTDETAKTAAQNWIRYQGYDLASLEINYTMKSGL